MFEVVESVTIDRPAEQLFGIAADPQVQLQWDPVALRHVEKLTDGPLRAGARFRGHFRRFGTVDYEYVEYEPGRRFSHHARIRLGDVQHSFDFEPVAEGTLLTQRIRLEPTRFARVMAPLIRPLLRRRMRVIDDELKQYAESPR